MSLSKVAAWIEEKNKVYNRQPKWFYRQATCDTEDVVKVWVAFDGTIRVESNGSHIFLTQDSAEKLANWLTENLRSE